MSRTVVKSYRLHARRRRVVEDLTVLVDGLLDGEVGA